MQQARQQAARAMECSSTAAWSSTHLAVGVELQQNAQARRQLRRQERCTGAQTWWTVWHGLAREPHYSSWAATAARLACCKHTRAKACAAAALPTACAGVTVPAASGRLRVRSTWTGAEGGCALQAQRSADATVDCWVLLGTANNAAAGTAQPAPLLERHSQHPPACPGFDPTGR